MSPTGSETSDGRLVQCYNKGCQQKFDPNEDTGDSCVYHPGPPYFHDAYKIWNCCNKKSTDFGTWMNYPGCTRGRHSAEKPVDIARVTAVKEIRPERAEDVIVWKGLNQPAERLAEEHRVEVQLNMETMPNARNAIERWLETSGEAAGSGTALRVGTPCRNKSCDKTYVGPESESEQCVHHPGYAVFHEGMKSWSCCNKKTSNFNAFLDQKGCEKGQHQWSQNEKVDKLKEDWYSSNGNVTINMYCKGAIPEDTTVHTDGQMLRINLKHGFGLKETEVAYELFGRIIPEESRVVVGERKVEIILKQRDTEGWPRLKYDVEVDATA